VNGLTITTSGCTIKGLDIDNFETDNGIVIDDSKNQGTGGNTIVSCFIGVGLDGVTPRKNGVAGVRIIDSANNNIGELSLSTEPSNVISGNGVYGVAVVGNLSTGNKILHNFIGTDFTGTQAVPNGGTPVADPVEGGVYIGDKAKKTVVGGTYARNLISGNKGNGVSVGLAYDTQIEDNYIGTKINGNDPLPNRKTKNSDSGRGIRVSGATGTQIGVTLPNVISGNDDWGVTINNSSNTTVATKLIGLGADETTPVPNGKHPPGVDGVKIEDSKNTTLIDAKGKKKTVALNIIGARGRPRRACRGEFRQSRRTHAG
jgi:hypothetical protein